MPPKGTFDSTIYLKLLNNQEKWLLNILMLNAGKELGWWFTNAEVEFVTRIISNRGYTVDEQSKLNGLVSYYKKHQYKRN